MGSVVSARRTGALRVAFVTAHPVSGASDAVFPNRLCSKYRPILAFYTACLGFFGGFCNYFYLLLSLKTLSITYILNKKLSKH